MTLLFHLWLWISLVLTLGLICVGFGEGLREK
jgi:hypothetical protein